MRFRAEQRLRRQLDFQRARAQGRRHDCGAFTLWYAPHAPDQAPTPTRVGVVASRVAVGDAVRRNRAKRRMREVFRRHQTLAPAGHDLLLVARNAINRISLSEIERRFVEACRKLAPSKIE
jgi:ribonuclease P protein component